MNHRQNVIEERKGHDRTIWLHKKFVAERLGFSDWSTQKNIQRWTTKKIDGVHYFDFDSIPNRSPKFYRDQFTLDELIGIKPKAQVADMLTDKLKSAVSAKVEPELIGKYMHRSGLDITEASQLAEAKAWLDQLLLLTKAGQHILFGFDKIKDVFEVSAKILSEKKLKGLKTTTALSLRNKLKWYAEIPLEKRADSMVHGLVNNQNAAIIGKQKIYHPETGEEMYFDVHLAVVYSLWLNVGKGNKEFKKVLHKEYESIMIESGLEAVSYQTLCKRTHQFNMQALFAKERHGSKYFNDNYMPYVSAERLQLSNTMWCGDGSSTKLLYRTSSGTARSLMCYRIADVASRKILGWCLYEGGDGKRGESKEVILSALKMAYKNTGVFACEFITDNGGGHGDKELQKRLKLLFKKHTTITAGNSQENYAETIIKSMNNFGRKYSNWGGSSWDANKSANKANFDNIDLDKLPTRDEAYIQAIQWIEDWNAEVRADGLSNNERYDRNSNTNAKPISDMVYRFVFGSKTQRDLSYSRGFVDITHNGAKIQFTIPDYETAIDLLSQKTGYKGTVYTNLYFDENYCDIYSITDEYILTASRTAKSHKSEFEKFENSWENHGQLVQRKEAMKNRANELVDAVRDSMEAAHYELLVKQKDAVKDDWEEINTAQIPLNQEAAKEQKTEKMSMEKKAFMDAYFGGV